MELLLFLKLLLGYFKSLWKTELKYVYFGAKKWMPSVFTVCIFHSLYENCLISYARKAIRHRGSVVVLLRKS